MLNKTDKIFNSFVYMHPEIPLNILRSSKDSEIRRFLEYFGAEASTMLDLDTGQIDIKINDDVFRKSAIYEELAHALQYYRDGNIEVQSLEYYQREIEVAECMLSKVENGRLNLHADEVTQTETNLSVYRNAVTNLGG